MPSAADRIDFGPPRDAGSVRAFGLALLVHALLIAALTWGVNWKRSDRSAAFEAELWSSVPQEAAPRLIEAPPPPPPLEPLRQPPAPNMTPPAPDVDIALEQEKKRKQLLRQKTVEAEKALEKKEAEALAKKAKELKAQQDQAKLKAAEEAKNLETKNKASQQDAQKQAQAATQKQRQDALNRMMGLVGATGAANATGSAQKSSGPSASYGAKVSAKIKPNIVFTDDIQGNPTAEVEVRSALDGTIMSQRLVTSSGNKAWDDAVIKAIVRTEAMPRDSDGRVPTPMIIKFRPKD